mmetsp:Transcript_79162/g.142811  ORF Transcript_79162/g.142811 Transcript_79162/m.142811 type:complete len:90 (-) Transcript_79162:395-664(-)
MYSSDCASLSSFATRSRRVYESSGHQIAAEIACDPCPNAKAEATPSVALAKQKGAMMAAAFEPITHTQVDSERARFQRISVRSPVVGQK